MTPQPQVVINIPGMVTEEWSIKEPSHIGTPQLITSQGKLAACLPLVAALMKTQHNTKSSDITHTATDFPRIMEAYG